MRALTAIKGDLQYRPVGFRLKPLTIEFRTSDDNGQAFSIERFPEQMRRRDEQKRRTITATAARLFATQPFHKVRLDAVASAARVGKGTLYVYFRSKEDLYYSIIFEGFAALVDRLVRQAKIDEQAIIRCVLYADETTWRDSNTPESVCDLLKKGKANLTHARGSGRPR